MNKAEMEVHSQAYKDLMNQARSAEREGLYRKAVEVTLRALEHVDGMMQYERKYGEREFKSVSAVDALLSYGSLLLDSDCLAKVESLLKSSRRVERDTSDDLGGKLSEARNRMRDNHRLWNYLEQHPETRQDGIGRAIGGQQDYWRSVLEVWQRMGLIVRRRDRNSYLVSLSTRMGQIVTGKCPGCGGTIESPKAMLWGPITCPDCGKRETFVILTTARPPTIEG
jgi:hypothetical protein